MYCPAATVEVYTCIFTLEKKKIFRTFPAIFGLPSLLLLFEPFFKLESTLIRFRVFQDPLTGKKKKRKKREENAFVMLSLYHFTIVLTFRMNKQL